VEDWLKILLDHVAKKPLVAAGFSEDDWTDLRESRKGLSEFTIARRHKALTGITSRSLILLHGANYDGPGLYLGMVVSRGGVSTLDSRIKIARSVELQPFSIEAAIELVGDRAKARQITQAVGGDSTLSVLTPPLSVALLNALASIDRNRGPLRELAAALNAPTRFRGTPELQEDAVRLALKAFGLAKDYRATNLNLADGSSTALARIAILEDAVVEHDARSIPGFDLVESHLTGRALFRRDNEILEVITANKRPLEQVFGVDLIYLNEIKQNVVMIQYKMLEKSNGNDASTEWIYRPDKQLDEAMERMNRFSTQLPFHPYDYRLNPSVFYMKFVKRDAEFEHGGIITPIEHFQTMRTNPRFRGPRGGFRITFNSLEGRYLRETPFLDLLRAGYVGAHAETTAQLTILIREILAGNKGLVLAIQSAAPDDQPDPGPNEYDD
jgi:hypothetical protein